MEKINHYVFNIIFVLKIPIKKVRELSNFLVSIIKRIVNYILYNLIGFLKKSYLKVKYAFKDIIFYCKALLALIKKIIYGLFSKTFWIFLFKNIVLMIKTILIQMWILFIAIIKNGLLFIYDDLLMIPCLIKYIKNNIFVSFSIFLILIINISGIWFFINQPNFISDKNNKWQKDINVYKIYDFLQNIGKKNIFSSVSYQNTPIEVIEGESLFKLLLNANVDLANARSAVYALAKEFDVKKIKKGWIIQSVLSSHGDGKLYIQRLSVPVSNTYDIVLEPAESKGDNKNYKYNIYKQYKNLTRYMLRKRVLIRDNFYKSLYNNNVPDSIIANMYKILSWDVDFQRDIKDGDAIEVLYECLYNQRDELSICDNILYISLTGGNKGIYLYNYNDNFYHSDGSSASKTLIKTPIVGGRLNSSFGFRTHPILGYALLHKGIDFTSAVGTPILASGDGVIDKMYYSTTYGNYIRIKHNPFLHSVYAHMQRFNPLIKEGKKVKQGDVIGYLGATGRVTGPHLHYEILVNGKHVNPMTVKMPSDTTIKNDSNFIIRKELIDSILIRMPTKGKVVSMLTQENTDKKLN